MPDKPIKPPNKRVDELVTDITGEMWLTFEVNEHHDVRNEKTVTFMIRKLAEIKADNERLQEQINEILDK